MPIFVYRKEAKKYGLHEALMIECLRIIFSNPNKEVYFGVCGRNLTKISLKAFQVFLPFFTQKQIKDTIKSLENQNVIITQKLKGNTKQALYAFKDEDDNEQTN